MNEKSDNVVEIVIKLTYCASPCYEFNPQFKQHFHLTAFHNTLCCCRRRLLFLFRLNVCGFLMNSSRDLTKGTFEITQNLKMIFKVKLAS